MTVEFALDPITFKIAMRLPHKRWRRNFKNIDEAVKEAMKEVRTPFEIDYVDFPIKDQSSH